MSASTPRSPWPEASSQREIAGAASGRRAQRIVREAIAAAADPRVVELPVNAPWKQVLVPAAPEALFVIYPKRQGFGLHAVPRELGSFDNRRDLPAEWGGLEGRNWSRSPASRARASATPSVSSSWPNPTPTSCAWPSSPSARPEPAEAGR